MTGAGERGLEPVRPAALGVLLALCVAAFLCPVRARAAGFLSGPLVQYIDAQELEDHADITVQFACTVFYVGSAPASRGDHTRITLRLGADCGTQFGALPPELPLVGGGGKLVTGARLDATIPGEVMLELTWSRTLDFVMAPSASGSGLRVRLLYPKPRKGTGLLAEPQTPAGYSVNLDSSRSAIARETVEAAATALQAQAYVSETDLEGEHWYRLRVGPFATRAEAQRVLAIAQPNYPRAWIAEGDEQADIAVVDRAGVTAPAAAAPTDPPLPDEQRAKMLKDARQALDQRRFPEAVDLLTRLLRQPEYPARADAQELLGLVRERAGQLAQAKAEYEEYLRRYPNGAAAARVRSRLQALISASLQPSSGTTFQAAAPERWTMAGSASVSYQYGKDQTVSLGNTTTNNTLSSALVYGDLLLRDRGERYDFTARIDAGYAQNFVSTFNLGNQDQTTAAYLEVTDKTFGLTGRFGRQTLASQGIVGLFDGAFVGLQLNPKWSVSAAAGLPVYTGFTTGTGQQKFGTVTAEFDPFHQTWVFDVYAFDQINAGLTERRSIGLQTRYSESGRTAVILVDYDIAFQQLNSATLIGNAKVGESWVLGFDADHRRSPLLELSNSLIGLNSPDVAALQAQYQLTPQQLRQLALDRTAISDTLVLSASRSLGERWQFMADLGALELSGTPASPAVQATGFPGVPAMPSTGLDKNASVQFSGSSLIQASDLHIFSLRFDDSPLARSMTYSWDARFVVYGAWRLGPRFSVEQLNDPTLGGKQIVYLPQVRSDWTGGRQVFELIAGYQLQNQIAVQQPLTPTGQVQSAGVDQRSLYVNLAYRIRF